MSIKRFIFIGLLAFSLAGCGILHKNQGVVGKASIAEGKARAKIEMVDNSAAQVNVERLDKVGALSVGVAYSLSKDTNKSPEVVAAAALNDRILALANKPDFKEAQAIISIVDQLRTNQVAGQKALAKKDKEIEKLGLTVKDLQAQKEEAVNNYITLADKQAGLVDQYKATLGQMDSWGGLGAIWYGVKRLITRLAWGLGIFTVLFLFLRIASMSNPIAAGVFQIFNVIGAWFVHIIQVLVPKAVSLAGNVSSSLFNAYKSTLTKVVDAIQMAKNDAAKTGKPVDIQTVLTDVAQSMNDDEKAIVTELKKSLNWK